MTEYPQRDAAVRAFQKRRKMQRIADRIGPHDVPVPAVASNPVIDKSGREPIFAELDEAIKRDDEQARRRVARAAGTKS